jgi:hypothetical protein
LCRKGLKIAKGKSEAVNRRTDNTMAKRKLDQRTNNDLQNITQKTKNRVTRTLLKPEVTSGFAEGSTVPAPHVTLVVLLLNDTNSSIRK